jgi:hypothetical protein
MKNGDISYKKCDKELEKKEKKKAKFEEKMIKNHKRR